MSKNNKVAIFAGGCFWCMEPPFDKVDGVVSTISGYTGGLVEDPTYEEVSSGHTGHIESLKIVYDSDKIDYKHLLDIYWRNIDPVDDGGQFCDRGGQYRSAIFYLDKKQEKLARKSKEDIAKYLKAAVATKIKAATEFYDAEEYHQDYYNKNPLRYKLFRYMCGRDKRLKKLWLK